MGLIKDITNIRFNRFVVLSYAYSFKRVPYWYCICDCGTVKVVSGRKLKIGHTKSCGCLRQDINTIKGTENAYDYTGKISTEYRIWINILRRCFDSNEPCYKNYGGRGITVCDRWLYSFNDFLSDVGFRPSKEYTLDRINNDGHYEPMNCRWATRKQQARNTRRNTILEIGGIVKTFPEWCEHYNINYHLARNRYYRGLSIQDVFNPIKRR
jgi:hypothetical protein